MSDGLGDHQVVMLDVGQGDCTAVQLRTGEVILIDSNVPGRSLGVGVPALDVLREFSERRCGVRDIDLLCLTHPDRDHYSGMADVLDWVIEGGGRVRNLVHFAGHFMKLRPAIASIDASVQGRRRANFCASSREFLRLAEHFDKIRRSIKDHHGRFVRADGCKHVAQFGSVRIDVLGPTSLMVQAHDDQVFEELVASWITGEEPADQSSNALSAILSVDFGGSRLLVAGDATRESLKAAIEEASGTDPIHARPFNLIKLPHHGARSSSDTAVWKRLALESSKILISAGCNRHYNHPHPETLADLRGAGIGAEIYCTNRCPRYWSEDSAIPIDEFGGQESGRASAYHGSCRFHVHEGRMHVSTAFRPTDTCPYHVST